MGHAALAPARSAITESEHTDCLDPRSSLVHSKHLPVPQRLVNKNMYLKVSEFPSSSKQTGHSSHGVTVKTGLGH